MADIGAPSGYRYADASPTAAHTYLVPAVRGVLASLSLSSGDRRIFDLGCGNGAVAAVLAREGYEITGIDASAEGIAQARQAHPELKLFEGSAYDDLAAKFGTFPVVLSLEVVEHLYDPRRFASRLHALVEPGGTAIVSAPYHGYLKDLALAISGRMDAHFTALWDHGHIKFWSVRTLRVLLGEAGFEPITFLRIGRIPSLAKAMIAVARKPDSR